MASANAETCSGTDADVRTDAYTRADVCADYRSLLESLPDEPHGRIEASFASKMLHTLDGNMSILYNRVCTALGIKIPSKWTIDCAVEVYGEI